MQVRDVWYCTPRFANMKLWYNRFTLSRVATAYFIVAFLHCIAQIILQGRELRMEHMQSVHLRNIIATSNVTVTDKFAILDETSNAVLLCHAIPGRTSDPHPCQKIFVDGNPLRDVAGTMYANSTDTCIQVLGWPAQVAHQAIREAITMMVFQTWLVGMSIIAIITESIPHVVAGLVTQLLSTTWSLFRIDRSNNMGTSFDTLVTNLGCQNVDSTSYHWQSKLLPIQISVSALNTSSLLFGAFLSWKVCKQFGMQSFTRVGGSKRIHHLNLLFLVHSVLLQLSTFFLIASLILWIEQLFDGAIASLVQKQAHYLGLFIISVVAIIPWFYMGWTAIRQERRRMMLVFLVTSLLIIISQMSMFISPVYRLTFSTWSFFGSLTILAYVLLDLTFFMAIVCRYFFGRGLAHFLHVQKALEDCNFTPVFIERGDCPALSGEDSKNDKGREGGATMPWDVEGKSVVKKLCLEIGDTPAISITGSGSTSSSSSIRMCTSQDQIAPDHNSDTTTATLEAATIILDIIHDNAAKSPAAARPVLSRRRSDPSGSANTLSHSPSHHDSGAFPGASLSRSHTSRTSTLSWRESGLKPLPVAYSQYSRLNLQSPLTPKLSITRASKQSVVQGAQYSYSRASMTGSSTWNADIQYTKPSHANRGLSIGLARPLKNSLPVVRLDLTDSSSGGPSSSSRSVKVSKPSPPPFLNSKKTQSPPNLTIFIPPRSSI